DDAVVLVPDGAAAAARLGGAGVPLGDLPAIGAAHHAFNDRAVGTADLLDIARRMVDAHHRVGGNAALVPTTVVGLEVAGGNAVELQEGGVRGGVFQELLAAGDALVHGRVLRGVAYRAFPVEDEHPGGVGIVALGAMVRGEEVRDAVVGAVVHQGARAYAAADHHVGHRADLIPPEVAFGADGVHVAWAAVAETAVGAFAQEAVTVDHGADGELALPCRSRR